MLIEKRLGMMTVLIAAVVGGDAAASCFPSYVATGGLRSAGSITGARPGVPCQIPAFLGSQTMLSGGGTLQGIDIVRPPRNGALRVEGAALVYTPGAAFRGEDSFFVRFRYARADGTPRKPGGVRFVVK